MNAFFIPLMIPLATTFLAAALVAGLYLGFLGLKHLARTERPPAQPNSSADDFPEPEPAPQPHNQAEPTPKIIRLSSDVPAPSSAQDMSQQAKIAAALTRARLDELQARTENPDHQSDQRQSAEPV